jgi:transcriptional regulator with XRE-family HTH domain
MWIYDFLMNKRPHPKATLATNLRHLMDLRGYSEAALARISDVSQKGINKILNQKGSATLDTLDKLAAAFGLNSWHLLMPDLPEELLSSKSLEKLYSSYRKAGPEGRKYIDHVAEREAEYTADSPKKDSNLLKFPPR